MKKQILYLVLLFSVIFSTANATCIYTATDLANYTTTEGGGISSDYDFVIVKIRDARPVLTVGNTYYFKVYFLNSPTETFSGTYTCCMTGDDARYYDYGTLVDETEFAGFYNIASDVPYDSFDDGDYEAAEYERYVTTFGFYYSMQAGDVISGLEIYDSDPDL